MIRPSVSTLWFAVLVLLCESVCLVAQAESPASFVGSFSDADARRLSNVSVLIESKDRKFDTRSDENGEFQVESSLPISSLISSPQSAPNIGVNGYASTDKVQRGHFVQVALVMDIPAGYHVNSNRPLESFLVATQLRVEVPGGVRVGAVTYPRALLRKFSFSNDKLSVYEGRAVLRLNVTVPANFGAGSMELKAKLRYQSCSDALCFPPQSREVKVEIPVVAANEPVKRINGDYFGRGR